MPGISETGREIIVREGRNGRKAPPRKGRIHKSFGGAVRSLDSQLHASRQLSLPHTRRNVRGLQNSWISRMLTARLQSSRRGLEKILSVLQQRTRRSFLGIVRNPECIIRCFLDCQAFLGWHQGLDSQLGSPKGSSILPFRPSLAPCYWPFLPIPVSSLCFWNLCLNPISQYPSRLGKKEFQ